MSHSTSSALVSISARSPTALSGRGAGTFRDGDYMSLYCYDGTIRTGMVCDEIGSGETAVLTQDGFVIGAVSLHDEDTLRVVSGGDESFFSIAEHELVKLDPVF